MALSKLIPKHPNEPLSEDGRKVSEAEYWRTYYEHHGDFNYEWNNGYLEEKPVSDYAQFTVYLWLQSLLRDFLFVYPIARMIGLEMGFRLTLPQGKVSIRKPDLAVVMDNNPVPLKDKDPSYQGVFDLCIESLSTTNKKNIERDTVEKKEEYANAGVREFYILDEREIETEFYTLSNGLYRPIKPIGGVIHSQVLPGFKFRLADLYRKPHPPQLIEDEVYNKFVSPFFRAERMRANELEQKAKWAQRETGWAKQETERAKQVKNRI